MTCNSVSRGGVGEQDDVSAAQHADGDDATDVDVVVVEGVVEDLNGVVVDAVVEEVLEDMDVVQEMRVIEHVVVVQDVLDVHDLNVTHREVIEDAHPLQLHRDVVERRDQVPLVQLVRDGGRCDPVVQQLELRTKVLLCGHGESLL